MNFFLNFLRSFFKDTKVPFIYATLATIIAILDWCFRDINTMALLWSIFDNYLFIYTLYLFYPTLGKILGSIILILEFILVYLYYIVHFNIVPNTIVIFLIQTNIQESMRFLSWKFLLFSLFCFFVLVFLWRLKRTQPLIKRKFSLLIAIILSLFIVIENPYNAIFLYTPKVPTFPIPYSSTFHIRHRIIGAFGYASQKKVDYSNKLSYQKKPLSLYVVIGESMRGDHLGINGYSKDTTPLLNKQDLINFGINRSCASMTYLSWKYVFYNTPCNQDVLDHAQVVYPKYFTQAGYNTMIVSQDDEDSMITVVQAVNKSRGSHLYKDNLFEAFKDIDNTQDKNKLFILNSFGSHIPYIAPTTSIKGLFNPVLDNSKMDYGAINPSNHIKIINTYDNTILFMDWQISHIIDTLKNSNEPSVLFFTSDHGEQMNENNKGYGHGGETLENFMVPLFVWVNTAFKQDYSNEYKALLENSKRYKNQLTHEIIWHSMMDIGGFINKDTKVIDKTRSIFSTQLKPQLSKDWFKVHYNRN